MLRPGAGLRGRDHRPALLLPPWVAEDRCLRVARLVGLRPPGAHPQPVAGGLAPADSGPERNVPGAAASGPLTRSPRLLLFAAGASLASAACETPPSTTPDPPGAPDVTSPADTAGDSGDPGGSPEPWPDPIARGATLDLAVGGPELTDATMAGDGLLLYAGQEQGGRAGGVWAFDVSDPASPLLLGHTDTWHLQRICWSGSVAWGMTRQGELMKVEVSEGPPRITDRFGVGPWGGGLDCADETIAVALGSGGVRLVRVDGPAPDGLVELGSAATPATDARLEGDRLWVLSDDRLTAFGIDASGSGAGIGALGGACSDVAGGPDWLAVAAGRAGPPRGPRRQRPLAPGDVAGPLVQAVDVSEDLRQPRGPTCSSGRRRSPPWLRGSGQLVGDVGGRGADRQAWVADWNQPFGARWDRRRAPGARDKPVLAPASPSSTTVLTAHPRRPLRRHPVGHGPLARRLRHLGAVRGGHGRGHPADRCPTSGLPIAIAEGGDRGGRPRALHRDRPRRPHLGPRPAWAGGLRRHQRRHPVCAPRVPDTDRFIAETFGEEEGLVALWSYAGSAGRARGWVDEAGIRLPVLADEDTSMRRSWFIPNGEDAFAANPRHYVVGADGTFAYVQTTVNPAGTAEAIRRALEAAR